MSPLPATSIAAVIAGVVSLMALAGWLLDIPAFRSFLPELAQMKANTAICGFLAAASLGLLAHSDEGQRRRTIASILAGAVVLISVATLVEYTLGVNLGIDQFVVADEPNAAMTSSPGRMAPNTGLGFAALGLALLASIRGRLKALTILAALAATLAMFGLIGYLLSAAVMYRLASFTGMSVLTAIALFALSLGTVASAPRSAPMRILRSAGPEGRLVRLVLPAVILVPVFLGWIRLQAERTGLFETGTGVAAMTASVIIVLVAVLYYGAWHAERLDAARTGAERLFQSVIDASPNGILMVEADGRIALANPRLGEIFGYRPDELKGQFVEKLLPGEATLAREEDRRAWLADPVRRPMGAGRDLRTRSKDGSEIFVEVALNPVVHLGETYVLASVIDITERTRVDNALRVSERRLRTVFDTVHLVVVALDREGKIEYVNPFLLSLSGYSAEELMGQNWFEQFIPPAEREERFDAFQESLNSAPQPHVTSVILTAGGVERTISWHNTLLRDSDDRVTGALSVGEDLTEQKMLEAQYQQAQKMEAVGRLAAGVAHDFNNILTVILAMCDLRLDAHSQEGPESEVAEIRAAALRAATLTRQLLAFSRQQVLEPRVVDVNSIIVDLEGLLARLLDDDVTLRTRLAEGVGTVRVDPGQLEQVLVNLAVNARDAMPTGGTITLETSNAELDATYATDHRDVRPGPYVMIAVTDTGEGMDSQTQAQIFQPFFTTKEIGKGTGLGLASVDGFVRQSEGYIWLYSEPGHGTCFKIYLPRVDASLREAGDTEPKPSNHGTETLLLVEDDTSVRRSTRRLLESKGYQIIEAAGGPEAIELVQRYPERIPLVITDVIMPGMSGRELVGNLKEFRPEMNVLYLSGYTDDAIVRHGVLAREVHFLQKPYTLEQLASKVRDAIGE